MSDDEIISLREYIDLRFASAEKALTLQAGEYERRLHDLNGESARIRAAADRSVSRELYDKSEDDIRQWRTKTDLSLSRLLTRSEFDTYKTSTDRALQVKEGETKGISSVGQIGLNMLSAIGMAVGLYFALHTTTPPAVPPQPVASESRVDDLVRRLDAINARINVIQTPPPR